MFARVASCLAGIPTLFLTALSISFALIGLPISTGMVGIWQNKVGNQVVSAFLILSMPLGLSGNTNDQIYLILGFVFSFMLYLELSYGHARYSRLARVMSFSKEYEDVLINAKLYIDDAENFLKEGKKEYAVLSIGYADGLVDALRIAKGFDPKM